SCTRAQGGVDSFAHKGRSLALRGGPSDGRQGQGTPRQAKTAGNASGRYARTSYESARELERAAANPRQRTEPFARRGPAGDRAVGPGGPRGEGRGSPTRLAARNRQQPPDRRASASGEAPRSAWVRRFRWGSRGSAFPEHDVRLRADCGDDFDD